MRPSTVLALSACLAISGCSSVPTPQDVTGVNTALMLARLRCEARDAIRESAIEYLRPFGPARVYGNMSADDVIADLTRSPDHFSTYKVALFNSVQRGDFEYYFNSELSYELTLNVDENNSEGLTLDLLRNFARKADMLTFGAIDSRRRQLSRVFRVTDSFGDLALKLDARYCTPSRAIDIIYPATGHLPFKDLISSFIEINNHSHLTGTETGPAIPRMADTLTFTTRFTGSFNPSLNYATVGNALQVADVKLVNTEYREDQHKLIVTVSKPDITVKVNKKGVVVSKQPATPEARARAANDAINAQRVKNVEDAIVSISNSLSLIAP